MDSVVYVMPSLYPSGGNKMCVEHVKRLARRGHLAAVSVVSDHPDDNAEWLEMQGIKIEPFTKKDLNKYGHVVATYWETYYFIKALKLDHPEFHYFVQSKEEDFENQWIRKQKVLMSLMDSEFHKFTESKWIQKYLNDVCQQNSIVVPNCLDIPEIKKEPSKGKPILLLEGEATSNWKNIEFGSRIAAFLKDEYELHLLTSTPYSRINGYVFSRFNKIHSMKSWPEALQIIANADVLYRPSTLEGFNGAMSEAMCLGVPFVGNKIPGNYECCIDGWNSLLVDVDDFYGTVEALKRLKYDSETKEKIVKNALKTMEQYRDWEKSIDILESTVFCLG